MLQPAFRYPTSVRLPFKGNLEYRRSAKQILTSTAVGKLDRVSQVGSAVVALISVSSFVVSYELSVDVDGRNVVYDTADLELGVLKQMP